MRKKIEDNMYFQMQVSFLAILICILVVHVFIKKMYKTTPFLLFKRQLRVINLLPCVSHYTGNNLNKQPSQGLPAQ